jgi:hypothetical protein
VTKFVEAFASKLGESWIEATLTPAFAFWAGGLGAWLWANRSLGGLHRLEAWFMGLDDMTRWVLLVGALLLVFASAVLVQRLTFGVLRVLEGYWPRALNGIRRRLTAARDDRLGRLERKIQELQNKEVLSPNELQELGDWRCSLLALPLTPHFGCPRS